MKHYEVWKVFVSFLDGSNTTASGNQKFVRSWLADHIAEASCGAIWCREFTGNEHFTSMRKIFRSVDCRYLFLRREDGSIKWQECGKD